MNKITSTYVFPENDEGNQFHYVSCMMDDIEEQSLGELTFSFDCTFRGYMIEVFEHEDNPESEWKNSNGLELIDFYHGDTLQDIFNYLTERYL